MCNTRFCVRGPKLAKNRISQLRKSRGLTQRALADRADTSQQQVQRIEAGVQGVRLELANRIAAALGCDLEEIFPSLAKRGKDTQKSRLTSDRTKFIEVGLDPDPNHWTVKFFVSDGRVFLYEVPSEEKDRLEKIISRGSSGIIVFTTSKHWVALNSAKIAATQFLFDRGEFHESNTDENHELMLHLVGAEKPIIFGVHPDTAPLDDDDDGFSSQLQRLFLELEMNLENEIVSFDDEDNERVYIRPAEFLAIEVPLICCEPALWNAEFDGFLEDEVAKKSASPSEKVDE